MDPYLEAPELWPDVRHRLISEIQSTLNPLLRPRYVARVELRVYNSDDDDPGRTVVVPDVRVEKTKRKTGKRAKSAPTLTITEPLTISLLDDEIKEARLEIRHLESGSLVTIVEILSPANKIRGSRGRQSLMDKRSETLNSEVHWVEIDLLRAGAPSVSRPSFVIGDYRVIVSRGDQRPQASFWRVSVRQPLPVIGIPLRGKDPDVLLDLGAVLKAAYDTAAYDLSVDYRREPDPPLRKEDRTWADQLLCEEGLR
jgi:hypothetical protein